MYTLPEKLQSVTPYDPITGTYKLRCDANESCLQLPQEILEEISGAVQNIPYNRYPDPYATELCQAFADYYDIPAEWVTAANGSDELLALLTSCFMESGDKLLTLTPEFSMYRVYAGLYEDVNVVKEKTDTLQIDVDAVIDCCNKENVRMVMFSNPCNPTSLGLGREEVDRLIRSVNALVVLDEAYMDFWDQSMLQHAADYDNLVILRTASKAVGMAAARLGFAVAGKTITNTLRAVKSPYNVNTISQTVGALLYRKKAFLQDRTEYLIDCRKDLQKRLESLDNGNPFTTIYPSVTNFVYAKTPCATQLHQYLLEQSIAVRCMGDALRITAAAPEDNKTIAAAIAAFGKEL